MGNGHGKEKRSRLDPVRGYKDEMLWHNYRGIHLGLDPDSASGNEEENAISQDYCMERKPSDNILGLDSCSLSNYKEDHLPGLDSDSDSASDNEEEVFEERERGFSKYSARRKERRAIIQHDAGNSAKKMDTVLVMGNEEEESVNVPEGKAITLRYSMNRYPRGYAIIINNVNFEDGDVRKGSDIDAGRLAHVFSLAHFTIILKTNVTSHEIYATLRKYSAADHEHFDAFVCCILSHGSEDVVHGIDGDSIKIRDLVTLYKGTHCTSLAGKPKLFFIQACQGQEDHPVVGIEHDAATTGRRCVPSEADMLIAQSTVPGYISHRDTRKGSWYIQSFANHFASNYKRTHLMDILTLVSDDVSKNKQMPVVSSTLRKQLYF